MSDCSLAGDETVKNDSSWNNWGSMLPYDWFSNGSGYMEANCVRSSCLDSGAGCAMGTAYACARGYYGKTTNGTSGCTRCPDDGTSDVWRMGGFDIEDCFLDVGEHSDERGTYYLSKPCYYTLN